MLLHRGQRISLRRVALIASDIVGIVAAIWLSALLRLGPEQGADFMEQNIGSILASVLISLVVFYAVGMYEREALIKRHASYSLPFLGAALALVVIILIFYARFQSQVGRGILLLSGVFIFFFAWASRAAYRAIIRSGMLSKNAMVIGDGQEAVEAVRLIRSAPDAGLRIRGIVAAHRIQPGTLIAGVPVVGQIERIRELADAFEVETLIVATSLSREPAVLRMLRPLRCSGIEMIDYVSLHEQLAQEIPIDHINDEWLMSAAMNSSVIHIRKIKRILDFSVALVGLLVGAPIMALTALLIRLDSKGPILYRQQRAGLSGRIITVLKFRSMRTDAEAQTGAVWSGLVDPRVTRVGRFIRKWRIDELPQLINVLRGEMSLVGPRPERPEFIEMLASAIPFYRERLMVPPGITGWAQVKYPYAASIEAARRKLQYDLYYIKHMSLFLDLLILLRTFKTIIMGLRHSEEEVIETGPRGELSVLPQPVQGKAVETA
ncbi:MAG: sugar transferase [Kiritimatiellae bacterium]|nr:sugar transferase [Kiritimatiellia bacterium]MDW8458469.1 sugar transferase [Verrucomicrobiota bacterium]